MKDAGYKHVNLPVVLGRAGQCVIKRIRNACFRAFGKQSGICSKSETRSYRVTQDPSPGGIPGVGWGRHS